jgi:hypothetical protein
VILSIFLACSTSHVASLSSSVEAILSKIPDEDLLNYIQNRNVKKLAEDDLDTNAELVVHGNLQDAKPADILAWTRGMYSSCADAKKHCMCVNAGGYTSSGGMIWDQRPRGKCVAKARQSGVEGTKSSPKWQKGSIKNVEVIFRSCVKTCVPKPKPTFNRAPPFCPDQCEGNCAFKGTVLFNSRCELNKNVQLAMQKTVIPLEAEMPTWKILSPFVGYGCLQKPPGCFKHNKTEACQVGQGGRGLKIWEEGFDAERPFRCRGTLGQVSCPCSEGGKKISASEAERRIMSQIATLGFKSQADREKECRRTLKMDQSNRAKNQAKLDGALTQALTSIAQTQAVLQMLKCWKKKCSADSEMTVDNLLDEAESSESTTGWNTC